LASTLFSLADDSRFGDTGPACPIQQGKAGG
jgi:hypothetical protein